MFSCYPVSVCLCSHVCVWCCCSNKFKEEHVQQLKEIEGLGSVSDNDEEEDDEDEEEALEEEVDQEEKEKADASVDLLSAQLQQSKVE